MMMKRLYIKYFKRKLFNKIFLLYSLIIVISITVLSYSVVLNMKNSFENREREYNEYILDGIGNYIKQKINDSTNIIKQIYLDSSMHSEILNMMENGLSEHLKYKLNVLSSSDENTYMGFEAYFNSCIKRDEDLLGISIYSIGEDEIYVYSNSSNVIYPPDDFVMKYLNEAESVIVDYKIIPAHKVRYMDGGDDVKAYSVAYKIRDQFSPVIKGTLVMDFASEGIGKTSKNYRNADKRNILLLTSNGFTIYDSSNRYYGEKYPYLNRIKNSTGFTGKKETVICSNLLSGYGIIAASVIPNVYLNKNSARTGRIIFLLALAIIASTITLTYFIMRTFKRRVNSVVDSMKKVHRSNFSIRIPVKNEQDEISEIASGFNTMCEEINEYINKVYVSEIKQKNAQMKLLQAQINPHFLYNTLEVIRMRAVTRGVNEVGEMIYLLSALLRSSIKEKTIVSIREEIKYSKMYLELFKIRYNDRLAVDFNICEDVLELGILKLSLQPLIENYIVHGMNTGRKDNKLTIRIFRHKDIIFVYSIDNGSGIEKGKLESIKKSLEKWGDSGSLSLGLVNVNERIKILYGQQYGVDIYSEENRGTVVMIKLPAKTKEELDAYVQDIDS